MKQYKNIITLTQNDRGIWDLDPSKGCSSGLLNNSRGCYNDCYAARKAKMYGFDFKKTVLRYFQSVKHERQIVNKINSIDMPFVRMGCSGDPSENWEHTFSILKKISRCNKEIVIITKHWNVISNKNLNELKTYNTCINTSVSALDESEQLQKCLKEYERLKPYCKSVLRIVSCDFNKKNETGERLAIIQDGLFKNDLTIDTVFRVSKNNQLVVDGIVNIKKGKFLGKTCYISKYNKKAYLGKCETCSDQCGVFRDKLRQTPVFVQPSLFQMA